MARKALLGAAVAFVALGVAPAARAATCRQFDVSGHWDIAQNSEGIVDVKFDLTQDGSTVGGTASFCERCGDSGRLEPFAATYGGPVTGTVIGSKLTLTIEWGYGRRGEYTAVIAMGGVIRDGQTRDLLHGDGPTGWSTPMKAACLSNRPAAAEALPSAGQPQPTAEVGPGPKVKRFGKAHWYATATQDTKLLAAADAGSEDVGLLRAGERREITAQKGEFYQLRIDGAPGGMAWVQAASVTTQIERPR